MMRDSNNPLQNSLRNSGNPEEDKRELEGMTDKLLFFIATFTDNAFCTVSNKMCARVE